MLNLNEIVLSGRTVADLDLKTSANGITYTRIRLAINNIHKQPEYFNLTAYGAVATEAVKRVGKGSQIYVKGRLHSSEYENDGKKFHSLELIANSIQYDALKAPAEKKDEKPAEPEVTQLAKDVEVIPEAIADNDEEELNF